MINQGGKIIFIFLIALSGFFCWQKSAWAVSTNIVISEIGSYETADYEWIEIHNKGAGEVNLESWKFVEDFSAEKPNGTSHGINEYVGGGYILIANSYAVIANKADKFKEKYPAYSGLLLDSSWSSLKELGERVQLKDDSGNIIEDFTYLACPNYSLERYNLNLEDYSSSNWQEHASSNTVGSQNSNYSSGQTITPPADENPSTSTPTDFSPSPALPAENTSSSIFPILYNFGDIVINEFVPDPADEQVEFVELYNKQNGNIILDGWFLYDGSGAKTVLNGTLEKYFVIEKPKGSLNNAGDIIILKQGETIIDQVAYGNWQDGNTDDNAPTASDPKSIARKGDGFNTFNNKNDFAATETITKGGANIITNDEQDGLTDSYTVSGQAYDYSNDIIISEIFPNPKGSDNEAEFIELFNKGEKAINLEGWAISDSSTRKYQVKSEKLKSTIIKSGDFFVVYRKDSKIALNNSGDEVKLYQPNADVPVQIVKYEKTIEGQSYNAKNAISTPLVWEWSEVITPGARNIIKTVNHPPLADFSFSGEQVVGQIISFDSSDTVDEDGDKLNYLWDFGTGNLNSSSTEPNPIFIYFTPGMKQVKLIVSDGENKAEVEKIINIVSAPTSPPAPLLSKERGAADKVIIFEFMPNPEGPDESEWIELKNIGSSTVNLINWQLDDEEGGSEPYVIKKDIFINPQESKIFEREETKIALNNTVDSVRLFNNLGELADEYSYSKTKEGVSFKRQGNSWLTAENIASVASASTSAKTTVSAGSKKYQPAVETTLEKIREFEPGDKVKVVGTVAVLPGVFSSQYFYIVGSPGVQVYSSKKLFPNLQIGDQIEINGELSETYGELRLKIAAAEDIKKIATSTPPEPVMTECDKIGENMEAQLVRVKGEVVDKQGSIIWLDDGNSEIEVYIKTGVKINKANINEGDNITVIGIVSQKDDSYRVMPRSQADIIFAGANREGEVLGEVSVSDEWALAQNNKKIKLMKYLLILAGGLIAVLVGVLWKGKR